jgi:hypothetical protein
MKNATKTICILLYFFLAECLISSPLVIAGDHVARSLIGNELNSKFMSLAQDDAKEFSNIAEKCKNYEDAEKAIKFYQSSDMKFVEFSWKFNDANPRDYFRSHSAEKLENLKKKISIELKRNFIERFIVWIDGVTS